MAFSTAIKLAEEVSVVAGTVTNIFVAYEMRDDSTVETRRVAYNFTPAELAQILAAGGPIARRTMARTLIKPRIKQAYLDWAAEMTARPAVTVTDLSQVNDPPLLPADIA